MRAKTFPSIKGTKTWSKHSENSSRWEKYGLVHVIYHSSILQWITKWAKPLSLFSSIWIERMVTSWSSRASTVELRWRRALRMFVIVISPFLTGNYTSSQRSICKMICPHSNRRRFRGFTEPWGIPISIEAKNVNVIRANHDTKISILIPEIAGDNVRPDLQNRFLFL